MGDAVAKILNVITTALVAVVVVFALLIVVGKPFGFHAYAVLSGSMEPAYHTGSLIYVKEVKPSELGQGDVITFMTGKDTTVTHRIVDEVKGEDSVTRFQTQGDANTTPDSSLVHPDNVIGTPVVQIPMLGYVVNYIQFPPGTYIAISVCALIVFLMFLPDLFTKGGEDEEDGEGEHDAHGRQPRGQQAARPAYAAGPQQAAYAQAGGARGEYGRPVHAQQPRRQQEQPMRQLPQGHVQQSRHPQGRPMQAGQHVPGRQVRPVGQQQAVQQGGPQQAQPAHQQARPGQHPTAASTAGANNPRLRNNQDIRSTQTAPKTNHQQARPARRPAS